jgi:hypothetical protein
MKRRLSVERLEDRTVPAVTSTFDAATGLLTVNVNQPFAGIGFDPRRQRIVVESDAVDYAQGKFTPDTFALNVNPSQVRRILSIGNNSDNDIYMNQLKPEGLWALNAGQSIEILAVQRWFRSSIYAAASCGTWRRSCFSSDGIE